MNVLQNNIRRVKDLYVYLRDFKNRSSVYHLFNKNTIFKQEEDSFYREQYRRFKPLIDEGIPKVEEAQKNDTVYICWLQGEKAAPPLVQACIASVRRYMPNKHVVIITENTIPQFVDFPDYIWEKRRAGKISNAHFSDLLRVSLLCKFGGVWCDATVLCTEQPPAVMTEAPMFVFKALDLSRRDLEPTICSSWYIAAWSNQRILLLTYKLLLEYWKTAEDVGNYFAFHIFLTMAARRYPEDWESIPVYNNHSPHTLQFEFSHDYSDERWNAIKRMSPIHKLNHHIQYDPDKNNYFHHVLDTYKGE